MFLGLLLLRAVATRGREGGSSPPNNLLIIILFSKSCTPLSFKWYTFKIMTID
jgi:hypothetical protein